MMSYIVSVDFLKEQLDKRSKDMAVVDVRFELANPEAGKQAYEEGHIPQAVYLDLNKDLSGPVQKHGGAHPLPDPDTFAKKVSALGIGNDTKVYIYDQANEMYASRAWWVFYYMGHQHVYLVDGGFKAWTEAGYEVTTEVPQHAEKVFTPDVRTDEVVHMEDVKAKMQDRSAILIDSRDRSRYLGENEPMYHKAGHIPGAKNAFWKGVFDEDGSWKDPEQLEEHFASFPKNEEIIVSCGSGVSACPNIIGLKLAGYRNVKLYPGSFSDWISYQDNEVETKDES